MIDIQFVFRSPRRRHRSPMSHYHDYRQRDRHTESYDDRSSANSRVRRIKIQMFQYIKISNVFNWVLLCSIQ